MEAPRGTMTSFAVLGAAGLTFATTTNVTIGLPEIARDLEASQSEVQFIQDVYMVVLGALVLPAGALLDRYGRRRGMLWGLAILAVCQLWSALAGSPAELILSRCLAGAGAALVLPGTLATITAITPRSERGRAVALWAGCTMLGAGVGILVGGGCVELGSWELSSVVVAALSVVTLLVVAAAVPETYDPEDANVDPVGALLAFVGLGALTIAVIELPVRSLDHPVVLGGFLVGLAFVSAFVRWELHTPRPMIDLRLFSDPNFAVGVLTIFLVFFGGYGWFFLCFLYTAFVLDYGPLISGVALVPFLLMLIPAALAGPKVAARFGRRSVMAGSLVAMAAGVAILALFGGAEAYVPISVGFCIFGIGVGLGQGPPTEAIIEAIPDHQQGVASAVNDCAREIGGAFGVALMGSLFNFGYRGEVDEALGATDDSLTETVEVGPAVGTELASHGGALDARIGEAVHQSVVVGWETAFAVAVGLFLLFALVIHYWPGRTAALDAAATREPEPVPTAPALAPVRIPDPPLWDPAPSVVAPKPDARPRLPALPRVADPVALGQAVRFAEQTNGAVALVQYADGPERWTVFLGGEAIAAFPVFAGDLAGALRFHDRAHLQMHAAHDLLPHSEAQTTG